MKRTLSAILRNGFTRSKKFTLDELTQKLYILKPILTDEGFFPIQSNGNPFWKPENFQNRIQLLGDIQAVNFRSPCPFFAIINRYENGDSYGIE